MSKNNQTLKTGFRLIKILEALSEKDLTKNEIKEWFQKNHNINFSDETLKLDINTLIKKGFKIKRGHKGNGFKLHLDKDFTTVKLTKEETALLCAIKDFVLDKGKTKDIFDLKHVYQTITPFIREEFEPAFLNFKFFNTINEKIEKTLQEAINDKQYCTIIYNSSEGVKKEADIFPQKIIIINEKPYLTCFAEEKRKDTTFRLDNIISVKKFLKKSPAHYKTQRLLKTRYKILNEDYEITPIENNERVIYQNLENKIIEINMDSEFFIVQRLITLGEKCRKINNPKIKKAVLKSLEATLELYK